jgi:hypothetical protein
MDISESGRMYARLGYDFLAVTDHGYTCSPKQLEGWRQAAGITIVPGEENGATDHIIELGVHAVTPTPDIAYAQRARAMRGGGGFVFACHPQEYRDGERNVRDAIEHLHAIEIYNGLREQRGTDETRNVMLWDELLAAGHRVWAVATDDFHCEYTSPGHGWVCVQAPPAEQDVSWSFLVEQLKRGAFYASTGPSFRRIALDDGVLHVEAAGHTHRLVVVGPNAQPLAAAEGKTLRWPVAAGLPYFRVEAHCGIKRAWSQPFFPAT